MKKTTVFRQLISNIILPLVASVVLFSCISYYYNKKELEQYYVESRMRIVEEIKSLLGLYDFSMRIHEDEFSERMKAISSGIIARTDQQGLDPGRCDLRALSLELKLDSSLEFIYVIDTNGIVVNTTFAKDKGLDFRALDPFFIRFFNEVRQGKKFVEDRFSKEVITNKIKKYTYQPSRDGRYIIELGFYSPKASELKHLLISKIGEISKSYPEISGVTLIMAIKNAKDPDVPAEDFTAFNTALKEKKNTRVKRSKDHFIDYTDYIFLDMISSRMFSGYVIKIRSTDLRERELVKSEFYKFCIIFLVTIIPLIILVYIRARKITNPIKKLNSKVKLIRGGNLSERIETVGNNEITDLSENFNRMVSDLQESYSGLEQKVQERTLEISSQKELIEEKNKEITDSINYAQRIQHSLLASEELLRKHLKDYFVFFRPKDIVSGDFFWGAELADGHFALVTADSTGHGVPGAIMSMLNISCLNEAVNGQKLSSTGEILNYARKKVIGYLSNDGSAEGGKDGMDCSIVKFDRTGDVLHYSAANNPVWIVRLGQLLEYSPDKFPVGRHDRDSIPFSTHEVLIQKGDMVYTLTDGFPDQFGGPKGKKFLYKKLKELLQSISPLPLEAQQQRLSEALESWQGELVQVDDICIIGVRI